VVWSDRRTLGHGTLGFLSIEARRILARLVSSIHFFGFLAFTHVALAALRARALAPLPSISNLEQALLLLTNDLQKQVIQLMCGEKPKTLIAEIKRP
jgi:hypothetical protein